VAVRWYLRYGLSYRDVEELLASYPLPATQQSPIDSWHTELLAYFDTAAVSNGLRLLLHCGVDWEHYPCHPDQRPVTTLSGVELVILTLPIQANRNPPAWRRTQHFTSSSLSIMWQRRALGGSRTIPPDIAALPTVVRRRPQNCAETIS
jgi:hypothetical protein